MSKSDLDARNKFIAENFENGIKIKRKSMRELRGVPSLLRRDWCASWQRIAYIQFFQSELRRGVGLRFNTDLIVTQEFFQSFLVQCGVPQAKVGVPALRCGHISEVIENKSLENGKHLKEFLEYQEGKSLEEKREVYTYTGRLEAKNFNPIIEQICSNQIPFSKIKKKGLIQHEGIGIGYKYYDLTKRDQFNLDIKFSITTNENKEKENVLFHTGIHAIRGVSLNIHLHVGSRTSNGTPLIGNMKQLIIGIKRRFHEFNTNFKLTENKALEGLFDLPYQKSGTEILCCGHYKAMEIREKDLNRPPPPDKKEKCSIKQVTELEELEQSYHGYNGGFPDLADLDSTKPRSNSAPSTHPPRAGYPSVWSQGRKSVDSSEARPSSSSGMAARSAPAGPQGSEMWKQIGRKSGSSGASSSSSSSSSTSSAFGGKK
jgi:hypothetical protein